MNIYFDKLYRYDRLSEPAGIAIPFREGELKDMGKIAIMQNDRPCMIQPKVTSRHADGSVRYLYIDFLADIPANKNIKGMNHGDINTTIEAIGLTLWKNI